MRPFIHGYDLHATVDLRGRTSRGAVSRNARQHLNKALRVLSGNDFRAVVWPGYAAYPAYLRISVIDSVRLPSSMGTTGWLLNPPESSEFLRLDDLSWANLPVMIWSDSADFCLTQTPYSNELCLSADQHVALQLTDAGYWISLARPTAEDLANSNMLLDIMQHD